MVLLSPLRATWTVRFSIVLKGFYIIIVARWVSLRKVGYIETYTDLVCCYRPVDTEFVLQPGCLNQFTQWWAVPGHFHLVGRKMGRMARAEKSWFLREAHQFDSDFLPVSGRGRGGTFVACELSATHCRLKMVWHRYFFYFSLGLFHPTKALTSNL